MPQVFEADAPDSSPASVAAAGGGPLVIEADTPPQEGGAWAELKGLLSPLAHPLDAALSYPVPYLPIYRALTATSPAERIRQAEQALLGPAGAPQAEQLHEAAAAPSPVEAGGHVLAAAVPFFGPQAAQAGKNIGKKDWGAAAVDLAALGGGEFLRRYSTRAQPEAPPPPSDATEPLPPEPGVDRTPTALREPPKPLIIEADAPPLELNQPPAMVEQPTKPDFSAGLDGNTSLADAVAEASAGTEVPPDVRARMDALPRPKPGTVRLWRNEGELSQQGGGWFEREPGAYGTDNLRYVDVPEAVLTRAAKARGLAGPISVTEVTPEEMGAHAQRAIPLAPVVDAQAAPRVPPRVEGAPGPDSLAGVPEGAPLQIPKGNPPLPPDVHEALAEGAPKTPTPSTPPIDYSAGPGRLDRAISSVLEVAAKVPGQTRDGQPLGPTLASTIHSYLDEAAVGKGRAIEQVRRVMGDVGNLNPAQQAEFLSGLKGERGPLTPQQQVIRTVLDKAYTDAKNAGIEVQPYEQNYVPRMRKTPPTRQEVVQFEMQQRVRAAEKAGRPITDTNALEAEVNRDLVSGSKYREALTAFDNNNLTKRRGAAEEPGLYRNDHPGLIEDYLSKVYDDIAREKYLPQVKTLLDRVPGGELRTYLDQNMTRVFGLEGKPSLVESGLSKVRAGEALTKVSVTGPFNQAVGIAQTMGRAGWGRSLAALRASLTGGAREMELAATRSGSLESHLTGEVGKSQGVDVNAGLFERAVKTALTPLRVTDKWNRILADDAGRRLASDLMSTASRGDRMSVQSLRELGIFDEARRNGFQLTDAMADTAGRKLQEATQFRTDPAHLPGWASTPGGRTAFQFLSFMYEQGKFTKDLGRRALSGDVAPLARFLAAAVVTGEVASDAKSLFKGYGVVGDPNDPRVWEKLLSTQRIRPDLRSFGRATETLTARAIQNILMVGGIGIVQSIGERVLAPGEGSVANYIPSLSDADKIAKAISSAKSGDFRGAARQGLQIASFGGFGPEAGREFLPSAAEHLPGRPGMIGRVRDLVTGKEPADLTAVGELFTGETRNPERLTSQRLDAAKKASEEDAARLKAQGLVVPPEPHTPEEKAAAAEAGVLRQRAVGEILASVRDGRRAHARLLLEKYKEQGVIHDLNLDEIIAANRRGYLPLKPE